MNSFLSHSSKLFRSLFDQSYKGTVNLIIGNESADLDSIVSSISLAYSRTNSLDNSEEIYLPIIGIDRQDIKGRFEVLHLFEKLELDHSNLIFLDDANLEKLSIMLADQLSVTLVDHNNPSRRISFLKNYVNRIIDHHEDKTQEIYSEEQLKSFKVKKIEKMGSCSTLIWEEITIEYNKTIDDKSLKLIHEVPLLLLGAIQLDTFNFDQKSKGNRWVDRDWNTKEELLRIINQSKNLPKEWSTGDSFDQEKFFNRLYNIKYNLKLNIQIGLKKLLSNDYKLFEYKGNKVGYSTVCVSVQDMIDNFGQEEIEKVIEQYCKSNELVCHFTLAVSPLDNSNTAKLRREMLIFTTDSKLLIDLEKHMQHAPVKLETLQNSNLNKDHFRAYNDPSLTHTRKILEPFVSSYFY